MLFGFVNVFISFKYQWTYIFIIRWISHGSHNLTCYYHCWFFPKMTQLFPGFRLCVYGVFITTYHHSNATSKNLLEWQWSVHSIATPSLTLNTLPLRSVIAVLICIFATHSNATPVSHSVATPTSLLKYTYTLRIFPPAIDIIPTLLVVVYSNGKYTN